MLAIGTVFRREDATPRLLPDRAAAEVHEAAEETRNGYVVLAVHGHAPDPSAALSSAKTLAPDVTRVRPELGQERVLAAVGIEQPAAEVDGALEPARDEHVPAAVNRHIVAVLATLRVAEVPAPQVLPGRGAGGSGTARVPATQAAHTP
ncbi:MAG: hypothetical protein HY744_21205 [Deltaproteobacteria bacterium]|nr:hypothetical protein [Deltaproteobacteria bacterium]